MAHRALETWVDEVAKLTSAKSVHWCDGSEEEIGRLNKMMVADGSLVRLDEKKHPNSFWARSNVNDVARVEGRTFICSSDENDAGPTNNWMSPSPMHGILDPLFEGSMQGRVMYVIPYLMGPAGSPMSKIGVEITDSPYVVANMRIMTRMGNIAIGELGDEGEFVKGLHSTGNLDPQQRYISHFPEENLIMSFSSNYGGNALLGKKCFALRIAGVLARNEGWMAEHMLILGITDPDARFDDRAHGVAQFDPHLQASRTTQPSQRREVHAGSFEAGILWNCKGVFHRRLLKLVWVRFTDQMHALPTRRPSRTLANLRTRTQGSFCLRVRSPSLCSGGLLIAPAVKPVVRAMPRFRIGWPPAVSCRRF